MLIDLAWVLLLRVLHPIVEELLEEEVTLPLFLLRHLLNGRVKFHKVVCPGNPVLRFKIADSVYLDDEDEGDDWD